MECSIKDVLTDGFCDGKVSISNDGSNRGDKSIDSSDDDIQIIPIVKPTPILIDLTIDDDVKLSSSSGNELPVPLIDLSADEQKVAGDGPPLKSIGRRKKVFKIARSTLCSTVGVTSRTRSRTRETIHEKYEKPKDGHLNYALKDDNGKDVEVIDYTSMIPFRRVPIPRLAKSKDATLKGTPSYHLRPRQIERSLNVTSEAKVFPPTRNK